MRLDSHEGNTSVNGWLKQRAEEIIVIRAFGLHVADFWFDFWHRRISQAQLEETP